MGLVVGGWKGLGGGAVLKPGLLVHTSDATQNYNVFFFFFLFLFFLFVCFLLLFFFLFFFLQKTGIPVYLH